MHRCRARAITPRAFGDRIVDQRRGIGLGASSSTCAPTAAAGMVAALSAKLADEFVGDRIDDDDPLGRHADLAGVHERAERRGLHRFVEIGVLEHDQRRLAAEFEQHRLQMLGGALGDDPADRGRSGEVDPPHRRMVDQRADDVAASSGALVTRLTTPSGKPASANASTISAWVRGQRSDALRITVLPQASGVAMAPAAEDDRRVPRRDPEDHADRLAQGQRDAGRACPTG